MKVVATKEITKPARSFESYVPKSNSTMSTGPISANESKNIFLSLKTNKCLGHDEVDSDQIKAIYSFT